MPGVSLEAFGMLVNILSIELCFSSGQFTFFKNMFTFALWKSKLYEFM